MQGSGSLITARSALGQEVYVIAKFPGDIFPDLIPVVSRKHPQTAASLAGDRDIGNDTGEILFLVEGEHDI